MDSNKSKRVVVYCRVATQAQLDGDHTLEAQSARLHEQAERLGYWNYRPRRVAGRRKPC